MENPLRDKLLMEYVCDSDNDVDEESWATLATLLQSEDICLAEKQQWVVGMFPLIAKVMFAM